MNDRPALDWDELLATTEPSKAIADDARAGVANAMAGYVDRMAQEVELMLAPPVKKPRKKKVKHEAKVQTKIMKHLGKLEGVTELERTNAGNVPIPNGDGTFRYAQMGKGGKVDIHFKYYGVPWALEVKIIEPYKTYATKKQKAYMVAHIGRGGMAAVVRSVEDVIKVLACTEGGEVVQW